MQLQPESRSTLAFPPPAVDPPVDEVEVPPLLLVEPPEADVIGLPPLVTPPDGVPPAPPAWPVVPPIALTLPPAQRRAYLRLGVLRDAERPLSAVEILERVDALVARCEAEASRMPPEHGH